MSTEHTLPGAVLSETALQVLTNYRRLRDIAAAYAREWPRLNDRLQPILMSLSSDMQETVHRDMTLIRDTIFAADACLAKAASALLVAADAAHGVADLPAQVVCRLEMIAQSASTRGASNVVYLPARRHRPARQDRAAIGGQCRIAEAENRVLSTMLDELENGLGQLTGALEQSTAMDA